MEQGSSKVCSNCNNTGIVTSAADHPGLEERRCCPHCRYGWTLFERIFQIAERVRASERARVA